MDIPTIVRHARVYARTEVLIAEIRMRSYFRKLAIASFAVALAVLGAGLLNLAAYKALEQLWGPVWTPLVLGLTNVAVAAAALIIAAATRPGPELAMAEELRKVSAAAMEQELRDAGSLTGLMSLLGGSSLEHGTARLLVPAITAIVGALRRRKTAAK